MTAEKRELRSLGESDRVRLREAPSFGGHQHDRRLGAERFDGLEKWSGFHDHPGSTAIWIVVDGAVPIVREVPEVDNAILHRAGIARTGRNAQAEGRREKIRE